MTDMYRDVRCRASKWGYPVYCAVPEGSEGRALIPLGLPGDEIAETRASTRKLLDGTKSKQRLNCFELRPVLTELLLVRILVTDNL